MKILHFTFLFSVQCWASPYFFKVPINIGIHKWTLGYNSFLQFWNPISASKYLFWGKFTISLIVRFKKVSAFRSCLKSVWGWLLAVAWEDSILVQESTGSPFWPTSEPEEKLPRNCRAREIVRENCKVRKVSAKKKENGADDESAHFGPAQEYERVSWRKKRKTLLDISISCLNNNLGNFPHWCWWQSFPPQRDL